MARCGCGYGKNGQILKRCELHKGKRVAPVRKRAARKSYAKEKKFRVKKGMTKYCTCPNCVPYQEVSKAPVAAAEVEAASSTGTSFSDVVDSLLQEAQ